MNGISEILNTPRSDEYLGEDGLLHCQQCKTLRQREVYFLGEARRVRCVCRCQAEAAARDEEARKAMELRDRIARYRSVGMTDTALRKSTFEADIYGGPEMEIAKRYVNQWEQMRREAIGLLIWGDVGTGKTYLAACIANALLDKGVPVMMTSFGRILGGMPGPASGEQCRYIASFSAFDLLIIDDLGAERSTEYAAEQVFNIIDAHYRARLPLIVTTNLTLKELKNPDTLAKRRIYDRVLERCVPLQVNRRYIRQENAVKLLKQAQTSLK